MHSVVTPISIMFRSIIRTKVWVCQPSTSSNLFCIELFRKNMGEVTLLTHKLSLLFLSLEVSHCAARIWRNAQGVNEIFCSHANFIFAFKIRSDPPRLDSVEGFMTSNSWLVGCKILFLCDLKSRIPIADLI